MSRLVISATCLMIIAGCDSRANQPPADVVEVVANDLRDPTVWELNERWEVGLDGSIEFYLVRGATRLPSGDWYVLEAGSHRIAQIGADGIVRRVFGAEGDGPGEFREAIDISSFGDTIFVSEASRRVHFFDASGQILSTRRVELDVVGSPGLGISARSGGEWALIGESYFREAEDGTPLPARFSATVFSLDPATGIARPTGLEWSHEEGMAEGSSTRIAPIFDDGPHADFLGTGRFVAWETPAYELSVYDLTGQRVLRIENRVDAQTVDERLLELHRLSHRCRDHLAAAGECDPAQEARQSAESLGLLRPAVGRIRGFASGHFAVLRADHDANPFDSDRASRYDYFDPQGSYLGSTDGVIPLHFDGRQILSLELNDFGVESIVLLDVLG